MKGLIISALLFAGCSLSFSQTAATPHGQDAAIVSLMSAPEVALELRSQLNRLPPSPTEAVFFLAAPMVSPRAQPIRVLVNTIIAQSIIEPQSFAPKVIAALEQGQQNDSRREAAINLALLVQNFRLDEKKHTEFLQTLHHLNPRIIQSLNQLFDGPESYNNTTPVQASVEDGERGGHWKSPPSPALSEEFSRLHGPTLKEWESEHGKSQRIATYYPFAREPRNVLHPESEPYFLNAQDAKKDFKSWLGDWLAQKRGRGKFFTLRKFDFESWKSALKKRHLIATGEEARRPHPGPGWQYNSTDIHETHPGFFRNEVAVRMGNVQQYPDAAFHVDHWLSENGLPVPSRIDNPNIEVSGLRALLDTTGRKLIAPTFQFGDGIVISYPHAKDVDLFLTLAWSQLESAVQALHEHQAGRQNLSMDELLALPLFDFIADYYHTSITGHFFFKVNNSMLMPEINVFLEELGLMPVTHGSLDLIAIRMDHLPFRQYFRQYLRRYSSPTIR